MNSFKRVSSLDSSSVVACCSPSFTTRLGSVSWWFLLLVAACKITGALPPERILRSAISDGGAFVAVGNGGTILSSVNSGPRILRESGTTNALESVAWGNGKYVAVGSNGVLVTSSDAVTWTPKNVSILMTSPRVAFGNDRFVVMGKGPAGLWTGLVSENASDWTTVEVLSAGPVSKSGGLPFGGLAFGDGKFLAAGGVDSANLVVTSVDGLFWKEQGTTGIVGGRSGAIEGPIAYGGGFFAAKVTYINRDEYGNVFERTQTIATSADGARWNRIYGVSFNQIHTLSMTDCGLLVSSSSSGDGLAFLGPLVPDDAIAQVFDPRDRWYVLSPSAPLSIMDLLVVDNKYVAIGSDVVDLNYPGPAVVIVPNPRSANVMEGGSVELQVAAPCFSAPVSYQWLFKSLPIVGATNASLELSDLKNNQSGRYSVTLRVGTELTLTGRSVDLVVNKLIEPQTPKPSAPTISVLEPLPIYSLRAGSRFDIGVTTAGSPIPSLQWFRNQEPILGATNNLITLFDVQVGASGQYSVGLRNSLGSATSAVARIEVYQQSPYNDTNESSMQVVEGTYVQVGFGSLPLGTGLTKLQVLKDGRVLDFPLTAQYGLGLFDVSVADAGTYSLRGTNSQGEGSSYRVTLDVLPPTPLQVWKYPSVRPKSLFSIVYGDAGFVAVGEQSSVAISTDGRDWSFHRLPASVDLRGIAFGNGKYVAMGGSGVLVSPDGVNWTVTLIPGNAETLQSVVFTGDRFYLVASTQLFTSPDGADWRQVSLPLLGRRSFNHLAFGNGVYVAVGAEVPIWTSGNGTDWVPRHTEITAELESVTFADGVFVAVGDDGAIWSSADGLLWKEQKSDISSRLLSVAHGNGKIITVGNRGRVLSSTKGSNWKKENSRQPNRLEAVAFGAGRFVAVGEDGVVLSSSDGASWEFGHTLPIRDLDGMISDSRRLVIVGKGGAVLSTTNGIHFDQSPTGLTNDLHGVGWSGNLYVAVGETETIMSSPDAVQWTLRNQSTNSSLKNVKWAAGMWVAVGTQGTIWTSLDGSAWTSRRSPTFNDLNDVAYGDGRFVVVGDNLPPNGTVLTSSDGINWTRNPQYVGKNLRSVQYLNGTFIATANDGLLLVSRDGIRWDPLFTGFSNNLRAIGHAANRWVAVGNEGLIIHSPQLTNWAFSYSPGVENLHRVSYFNSRFYAIGNRGTLVASDFFVRSAEIAARVVLGQLELRVSGDVGVVYRLEVSDRLPAVSWTTLTSLTMTDKSQLIADPEPARMGARFYRLVSP